MLHIKRLALFYRLTGQINDNNIKNLHSAQTSWIDAKAYCASLNMRLATLDTSEKANSFKTPNGTSKGFALCIILFCMLI
jgi:hypothetical protein